MVKYWFARRVSLCSRYNYSVNWITTGNLQTWTRPYFACWWRCLQLPSLPQQVSHLACTKTVKWYTRTQRWQRVILLHYIATAISPPFCKVTTAENLEIDHTRRDSGLLYIQLNECICSVSGTTGIINFVCCHRVNMYTIIRSASLFSVFKGRRLRLRTWRRRTG